MDLLVQRHEQWKPSYNGTTFGTTARFTTIYVSTFQVDLFNSRDLDSRFSDRELAAVNEWLASGASIHAMRDHPAHGTAMLGE